MAKKKKKKIVIVLLVLLLVVSGFLVFIYPPPEEAFTMVHSEVPQTIKVGETLELSVKIVNKMLIPHWIICSPSGYLTIFVNKEGDPPWVKLLGIRHAFIFGFDSLESTTVFQPIEEGEYNIMFMMDFGKGTFNKAWRSYTKRIDIKIQVSN